MLVVLGQIRDRRIGLPGHGGTVPLEVVLDKQMNVRDDRVLEVLAQRVDALLDALLLVHVGAHDHRHAERFHGYPPVLRSSQAFFRTEALSMGQTFR